LEGWEEIHGFATPGEFRRFLIWIADAIGDGSLVEVAVVDRYSGSEMFEERWFAANSGQVWRLVAPEPPFLGVFLMVDGESRS
jgi:hypothetical protein